MALPSSGVLSFNDLKLEFGDTYPVSLNEFYAGGGKVPANTGQVPSSGQISMDKFYGAAGSLRTGAGWKTGVAPASSVYGVAQNGASMASGTARSGDGTTFTTVVPGMSAAAGYTIKQGKGTYLNGLYYLTGTKPNGTATMYHLLHSSDMVNWTKSPIPIDETLDLSGDIGSSLGRLFGGDTLHMYAYRKASHSTDLGVTWSGSRGASSACIFIAGAQAGLDAGCDGLYVQAALRADAIGKMESSPDLLTWTPYPIFDELGNSILIDATGGTTFMYNGKYWLCTTTSTVGGQSYKIINSVDGIYFNAYTPVLPNQSTTNKSFTITKGDTYLLAVYTNTSNIVTTAISEDGVSWTATPAIGITPKQVVFTGTHWVIFSGTVMKYVHA